MARMITALLLAIALCAGCAQAHELEGCSFPANISSRANLTVAGAALDALDGSDLFASHGTVLLPTDAAFADLLTTLNVSLPTELLADFANQTIAILAYHYLPQAYYTEAQLVGNGTIETGLGELASEASGRNVTYELRFQRRANGQIRVRGENSTATILDEGEKICNRQVYTIDTVLIPEDDLADIPTDIPEAVAARVEAEEAEEGSAPPPESDGDEAEAEAPGPDQGAPATAAASMLALGALSASLLLL